MNAVAETMPGLEAQFRRVLESAEALIEAGEAARAEELLRLALRLRPGSAAARNALGMALFDLGRIEEALGCFERTTENAPEAAGAWGNLGMTLKTLDRFDESIAAYDRALALDPGDGQLRLNRAVALLRAGRMAEAWPDYESRLALRRRDRAPERLLPTLGADGPDLRGRSVLLTHEEGFGDTLQFVRYAPMLAALGARVSVAAPAELTRLLRGVDGVSKIVAAGANCDGFDFVCPSFSLPRAFSTDVSTIPGKPYLRADPEDVARWRAILPWSESEKLRVGLVWAGQARPWLPGFCALDQRRSAGLGALAALAAVDALFVSLQHGAASTGGKAPFALRDPMPGVRDFADTAAVIAHLDVVVSVDTAVAHLAGGMGKPVFLVDRFDSCWRWLSGRTHSPWYPGLRIFRQARPGEWEEPMRAVAAALGEMARAKEAGISL